MMMPAMTHMRILVLLIDDTAEARAASVCCSADSVVSTCSPVGTVLAYARRHHGRDQGAASQAQGLRIAQRHVDDVGPTEQGTVRDLAHHPEGRGPDGHHASHGGTGLRVDDDLSGSGDRPARGHLLRVPQPSDPAPITLTVQAWCRRGRPAGAG